MTDDLLKQVEQVPLFKDKEWRWAPEPFSLSKAQSKSLQGLGHKLANFQQACHQLYLQSIQNPDGVYGWIAPVIDTGKPAELIAWNHQQVIANPKLGARVIRPDLLLQDVDKAQFALSEIDSVPGGIGVLAAMNQVYSQLGFRVTGGESGMLEGMLSLGLGSNKGLNKGSEIWVSDESEDYRPEMQWLAEQLNKLDATKSAVKCIRAEEGALETLKHEQVVYRFFEMFDYANIPAAKQAVEHGHDAPNIVAPMQYHLEEKLWLALFKLPSLRNFWKQHLRESHRQDLEGLIPTSWWFKQHDLPVTASLPYLDIVDWQELKSWSQTQRQLVLKISGFNELAWGGRGVHIGHDMSQQEWAEVIDKALADDESQWLLQQFESACTLEQNYYNEDGEKHGEISTMEGRVRLCPYYFTNEQGKTELKGCLATVVPADKKKIHGMSVAVMSPCS